MKALYASHNQVVYGAEIHTLGHIAELSRGGNRLETLTSADTRIIFWFNTRAYCAGTSLARVNRRATELLLATTSFTGRDVPFLRGDIVLTGRDADGNFTDLTDSQIQRLLVVETRWLDDLRLSRRINQDTRRRRRATRKSHPALCFGDPAPFR